MDVLAQQGEPARVPRAWSSRQITTAFQTPGPGSGVEGRDQVAAGHHDEEAGTDEQGIAHLDTIPQVE
jgi:hypothetical protein